MAFKPMNTKDETTSFRKTLLYSLAGWGKTTQAKHMKRVYGKGFIISGEAGLSSIRSEGIDYLPFTSFDGAVDEAKGVYSFVSVCRLIVSKEFKDAGYKWIMLDSLTELSDMVFAWADAKAVAQAAATGKKQNGFEVWGDYKDKMVGSCKFIRDLPYHVVATALAKTTENDDGDTQRVPMLQGNAVQAQVPGIFDNVLCGITKTAKEGDKTVTKRLIVTSAYGGWQGKVRDESGTVLAVEETGDITDILLKLDVKK
jgi:hypothetical protein